eukprot:gene8732-6138_t
MCKRCVVLDSPLEEIAVSHAPKKNKMKEKVHSGFLCVPSCVGDS